MMAVVRLSVRPSVCPVPDAKSITEGRRKLNIGRKEAMTRVTPDPFIDPRVIGQGHQAA